MIENLKLYSEGIQLMRHQSDNKFQDSPKITKNREQYQVSTCTGFLTGVENMKGGHGGGDSLKFNGANIHGGAWGRGLKAVLLKPS